MATTSGRPLSDSQALKRSSALSKVWSTEATSRHRLTARGSAYGSSRVCYATGAMQLDLTDEEKLGLLNLLTDGRERSLSALATDLSAARHPDEVRCDRAGTTAAGSTADARGARPEAPRPPKRFTPRQRRSVADNRTMERDHGRNRALLSCNHPARSSYSANILTSFCWRSDSRPDYARWYAPESDLEPIN